MLYRSHLFDLEQLQHLINIKVSFLTVLTQNRPISEGDPSESLGGSREDSEEDVTLDYDIAEITVLGQKVRLLQPGQGFRTSLDSVMVAAACPVQSSETVLDLGCGVGGASFCLLERVPTAKVTGIDVHPGFVNLATKNSDLNYRSKQTSFLCADVRKFSLQDLSKRFDHVLCNPPYEDSKERTPSPYADKEIALGQEATSEDWILCALRALKPQGSLTCIHRAEKVDQLLLALGTRFGAIELIPLYSKEGQAAKRVIIRARKDRKSPATIHPGFTIHHADGSYTDKANAILQDAQGLIVS